jgi:hypothetical protein
MPSLTFFTSLAGGQVGGSEGDFVIVEWTDSGESGYEWIAPENDALNWPHCDVLNWPHLSVRS